MIDWLILFVRSTWSQNTEQRRYFCHSKPWQYLSYPVIQNEKKKLLHFFLQTQGLSPDALVYGLDLGLQQGPFQLKEEELQYQTNPIDKNCAVSGRIVEILFF